MSNIFGPIYHENKLVYQYLLKKTMGAEKY